MLYEFGEKLNQAKDKSQVSKYLWQREGEAVGRSADTKVFSSTLPGSQSKLLTSICIFARMRNLGFGIYSAINAFRLCILSILQYEFT